MIALERVRKSFGQRRILDGITASFDAGEVVVIAGPSGQGKSTLLRCINGLERIDDGRIVVGNAVLGPPGSPPLHRDAEALLAVRRRLGMVFQQFGLFAHRTALGNVTEGPVHVLGLPRAEARERGMALLDRVGLAHRRDAFPRELSGGEQQRVAIARALAMKPAALLLDEPTSALDPALKREVLAVLRDLASEGATMIVVTHEVDLFAEFADRVLTLRDGHLEEDVRG